jgi:type IV pilus assembly protein PilA
MYNKLIRLRKSKKGFTLVELIVVLVILAILAAILVPTLIGYIDKARQEKDFSTAQSIRVAVQSVYDEYYGKGNSIPSITTTTPATDYKAVATPAEGSTPSANQQYVKEVLDLSGVSYADKPSTGTVNAVTEFSFTFADNKITDGTTESPTPAKVVINGSTYTYSVANNTWTAKK